MVIPFRDLRDSAGPKHYAGFLKFEERERGRQIDGALFLVNDRGEPIDFTWSSVRAGGPFLWRPGEARRSALASLIAAIFDACPRRPVVLLALASEIPAILFREDILVEIPVCLVAEEAEPPPATEPDAEPEAIGVHLFWVGAPPAATSPARAMIAALRARQLLLEPFERAAIGIAEVRNG
jgi:hypothetical protein